jgi:hypothetical protein
MTPLKLIKALRKHLSYANVTASLALFLALSGGAYAAVSLSKNSVGAKQIKAKAVGKSELRARSVGAAKLAPNAVSSPAVRDGSLLGKDFKQGELPAGPQGAEGPTGPRGPSQLLYDDDSSGGAVTGTDYGNNRNYEIPAGTWWVSWSSQLDTASGPDVTITCRLLQGSTNIDERQVSLSSTTDKRSFVLEGIVTGPASLGHQCRADAPANGASVRYFRFSAVTADTVTDLAPAP